VAQVWESMFRPSGLCESCTGSSVKKSY